MNFMINNVGYNYSHPPDCEIFRPAGTSDYLFLFFPCEIYIKSSEDWKIFPTHACMIYTPSIPQYYRNPIEGFTNDWFHFTGNHLIQYFEALGLPLNTTFYLPHYDFIRSFIKELEKEYLYKDLFWEEQLSAMVTEFFIHLARDYRRHTASHISPHQLQLLEQFKSVRTEILTHPESPWDIDTMCSLTSLSRSRFSVLYKSFFGYTPKEDLINARIKKAQYLLSTNNLSVSEVAYAVGYENIYHFNRQFKKLTGISPGKWS